MTDKDQAKAGPITIKKYANRRLYNTATSSYVTLDHLCQMVRKGDDFVVYDAKTGEDITRSVLTHIIVEEESKGQTLLPISFLRQLIGLYGDNMQWMVPRYLEHSMQVFSRNQEQMREYFQQAMSGMFPFAALDEMSKQNAAVFERAMQMFSPFAAGAAMTSAVGVAARKPAAEERPASEPAAKVPEPSADSPPPVTGDAALDRSLSEFEKSVAEFRDQVGQLDDMSKQDDSAASGDQAGQSETPAKADGRRTGGGRAASRSRSREAADSK